MTYAFRVEQEDFTYISGAYNEFFKHYPYCYGYWKKYAELAIRYSDSTQVLQVVMRIFSHR